MAFFKFRKGGDDQATTAPQPESIEALRRRAKHRLIGAAVLVLIGVIGFPLLVDKQPRPVAVDIPIEIPDKAKVKPLAAVQPPAAELSVPAQPAASVPAAQEATPAAAVAKVAPPEAKPEPKAEPKAEAKAEPKAAAEPKPPAQPADEGSRAQALLEGKAAAAEQAAAKGGRFVVQVGAFAEAPKAREVRLKVERAGLKTYTHVAETKDGQRIRVRVGPFATRADAEKAADKIKKLDLPAIILTL